MHIGSFFFLWKIAFLYTLNINNYYLTKGITIKRGSEGVIRKCEEFNKIMKVALAV